MFKKRTPNVRMRETRDSKSNDALILIAIIGVVGTVIGAIITVVGNYNVEKLRQESALTQIALVSIGLQGRTAEPISSSIPSADPAIIIPATSSQSTHRTTSLYDDFNNVEFDNDFNHHIWEFWHDNLEGVSQENGVLEMQASLLTSLKAREQDGEFITTRTYYEAKIKLSDNPIGGAATIKLHVNLSNNSYWTTQCGLLVPDIAFCEVGVKEQSESTYVKVKRIDVKNWYMFRIVVNPETRKLDYYIDGE